MSDVTTFAAPPSEPTVDSPLARSRRTTELTLVFMAAVITGTAYTVTALGTNAEIPPGIIVFVAILLGLLLCAHVMVRLVARGADGTMLPLVSKAPSHQTLMVSTAVHSVTRSRSWTCPLSARGTCSSANLKVMTGPRPVVVGSSGTGTSPQSRSTSNAPVGTKKTQPVVSPLALPA